MQGPILFLVFVNDLTDCIYYSTLWLFADDCLLYNTIKSPQDAIDLQKACPAYYAFIFTYYAMLQCS